MADDEPKFEIISRKEAISKGLKHYFTGRPCHRGHLDRRYVASLSCFSCSAKNRKEWRSENPDRSRELRREWSYKNPEKEKVIAKKARDKLWDSQRDRLNKERREARKIDPEPFRAMKRRSFKKLYEADPQRFRDECKAWRLKNPEKSKEMLQRANDKWAARNPLAPRAKAARRRARKRKNGGNHTAADIADIFALQKKKCAYCRIKLGKKYHVDHIIALVNGGSNGRKNLQILCAPCNLSKNAKDPIDHARNLGKLL